MTQAAVAIDNVLKMVLTDEENQLIFYKNAEKLLKIWNPPTIHGNMLFNRYDCLYLSGIIRFHAFKNHLQDVF